MAKHLIVIRDLQLVDYLVSAIMSTYHVPQSADKEEIDKLITKQLAHLKITTFSHV